MFNDRIYGRLEQDPFQKEYQTNETYGQLRQSLVIKEIIRCGEQILGETDIDQEEHCQVGWEVKQNFNTVGLRDSYINFIDRWSGKNAPQKRYLYEHHYDYGTKQTTKIQSSNQNDQISFTLSSDDNHRNYKQTNTSPALVQPFQQVPSKTGRLLKVLKIEGNKIVGLRNKMGEPLNKVVDSRDEVVESRYKMSGPGRFSNSKDRPKKLSTQNSKFNDKNPYSKQNEFPQQPQRNEEKPYKFKKGTQSVCRKWFQHGNNSIQSVEAYSPIGQKETSLKKTYQQSNNGQVSFATPKTKRKQVLQIKQKFLDLSHSKTGNHLKGNSQFHTPQRNDIKNNCAPLSQQIIKNVYRKLKTQVQSYNSIQFDQSQQRKKRQNAAESWKLFILRSDKWLEQKKNHILQKQIDKNYTNINPVPTSKDRYLQNKFSFQFETNQNKGLNKCMVIRNDRLMPQVTFNIQRNKQSRKKEGSVENCINKLKVQTQLLKVKLLNPLKNQQEDNNLEYRKVLQSKKSIQIERLAQQQKIKRLVRNTAGFNHIKSIYGNCIFQNA